MKRFILLFGLVFAFAMLKAQDTYHFRTDAPQGFSVTSSTESHLSLHYSIQELGIANIENGEVKGQEIILKGQFAPNAEGHPNLPVVNRYVAIPQGATVSLQVKENASTTIDDIDLLPAMPRRTDLADGPLRLRWNADFYGKDAVFPSENVVLSTPTQIRSLDVVMLSITPFRYNPVRKTLEVIYDIDIEIRFEGGNGQFGESRYLNPDWTHILRNLVINSEMIPTTDYYSLTKKVRERDGEGCEYLIISPDDPDILAWADTLKAFRTKQGITTKVVTLTECGGNNADSIRNYILDAYYNWAIPPAAVLLFGGWFNNAGIRPFTRLTVEGDYGVTSYPTDYPYCDMNGDSLADMAVSRITARTVNEYRIFVEKTIQYESNPPTDAAYYDRPIISTGHEDNKWFLISSQSVNGFYHDKLGKHPTNIYMVNSGGIPTTTWSTGTNAAVLVDYFGPDGQGYFPRYLIELDDWRYMFENQYLVDALSEGSFLTLFRDHSGRDVWCSPYFYSSEIQKLRNEDPTFLLSIGCNTADYQQSKFYNEVAFITTYCNAPQGAMGGIGAVTVTRSQYNDILTWGMIDYIWPDFMPTLGSWQAPDFVRPTYGMVAGKLFLNQHVFMPGWWQNYIDETNNVFHSLGDAYLNLYTETPQPITIDANLYHSDNQWEYSFTAEEGTLVCFSKDDEILMVVQATGEPQSVTLPQMEVGEQFTLTATKQNRFRFMKVVTVIAATQPYVYLDQVQWQGQDENDQIDHGENIWMDLDLRNAGLVASDGGNISLICESPYVEIQKGTAHYSHLEPEEGVVVEKAFNFKVARDVPDQTILRFKVLFYDDGNTHHNGFENVANAPIIKINPEFRIVTDESKPSTHIKEEGKSFITFTLQNVGHSAAEHLSAYLSLKAPFVSVTNPTCLHEHIMPDENKTLTYELIAVPNVITEAWLQSKLHIQYGGEYHTYFDTIVQFGCNCENFENDTMNPFFVWQNPSSSWDFCADDPYEGQYCYKSSDTLNQSSVSILPTIPITHNCKISFYYKTDPDEVLQFRSTKELSLESNGEWTYFEFTAKRTSGFTNWTYRKQNPDSEDARIDNICFPPIHRTIAFAGNDVVTCHEAQVELNQPYAYDCDSVLWMTDGDGHFDYDTLVNPVYFPGSQDLALGSATLTLTAFGNDTIVSSTTIHFVDEISLGAIVGDSVVNKLENPISHYSIENQSGMNYVWTLEPALAGSVYDYGNAVDILWNQHEGAMETTLSVIAENGCEMELIRMNISLIGTGTEEWHHFNFDLFPNPTDGKINLVLSENLNGKAVVEVYNLLGERLMQKRVHDLRKDQYMEIDLNGFVSGLYIIKLSTENGNRSKKVSVR